MRSFIGERAALIPQEQQGASASAFDPNRSCRIRNNLANRRSQEMKCQRSFVHRFLMLKRRGSEVAWRTLPDPMPGLQIRPAPGGAWRR